MIQKDLKILYRKYLKTTIPTTKKCQVHPKSKLELILALKTRHKAKFTPRNQKAHPQRVSEDL